jgi:Bacterial Ig-like domain (group 1)
MRSTWDGLYKRLTHRILVGITTSSLLLAGCGGGGVGTTSTTGSSSTSSSSSSSSSSGGSSSTPGSVVATAANVQMLVGSSQIKSDGSQKVVVRVIVTDANGIVIPKKVVSLSIVDASITGGVFLDTLSSSTYLTDANGQLTANLNMGKDQTNRTIQVKATVDTHIAAQKIDVVGTSIKISGASAMVSGSSNDYKVTVVDAGGNAISEAPVTFTSTLGNTVTPLTTITNSAGQATFTLTANQSGTETITTSSLGASATQSISISASNFNFVNTAPYVQQGDSIDVNTSKTVAIKWLENNAPKVGASVTFNLTRGSISLPVNSIATTDANGIATATFQSSQVGSAKISATGSVSSGQQAPSNSMDIAYITETASAIVLQADKTTLPVNTAGSQTFQSRVTAIVRDSNNNLVQNATVTFAIVSDESGGSLSASSAVTDINGQANVYYIAGTNSSAQNGVRISATVQKVGTTTVTGVSTNPNQALANHELQLTVGGKAKYVRIGTDNKVAVDGVRRIVSWTAIITDSSGGPVANQNIQFILRSAQFRKGALTWDGTTYTFANSPTPLLCTQEDTNLNGALDTGEDKNGDGKLTPGDVATVASSSTASSTSGNSITITSGSTGFADAFVIYPASFAYWVNVTLQAKISVDGTESSDISTFTLPGLISDYQTQASPPPGGLTSPYGYIDLTSATGCTNTN